MRKINNSIVFCFLFFVFRSFCFSQDAKPDSLVTFLNKAKEDTVKIKTLNNLFAEYEFSDDKKAKEYLDKALELARKIDYKKGLGITYTNLGYYEEDKFNYTEALKGFIESLKARQAIGDKKGIAKSYSNIGSIYCYQGNYPEALKNFLASLKIREEMGDKQGTSASYNNLGVVYYNQGNFKQALKNQFSALKISQEINDQPGVADAYNNIGITYSHSGNRPEALKNYLAALKINESIGNKIGVASSDNNIGLIYYYQGNYEEALKNYFACLKIMEEKGEKAFIAGSYTNIGNVYTKQKKYKEAAEALHKAEQLSKEIGNTEYLRDAYNGFVSLDSAKGSFKEAFEAHKLYTFYRDSLDNQQARKKSLQSQMTYDFEKKSAVADAEHKKELENQQALSEEKSRKQTLVIIFVILGLVLVLVFAGFISRSLRITRKQKHIIELQKDVVEQQKDLVEEKQKEILDSINYAKRIQYALLADNELLKQNFKEHFVMFKPKDIVSGDFYWAIKKDNRFYLAICDSTGHGVPGAFMSLLNISYLNEAISEKNIEQPDKILNHVRQRLIENISQEGAQDGMDGILLCFDKGTITYAAAHNAPVITRNQKIIELTADKMPIGKGEKNSSFTLRKIDSENGDTFYFYTDGYADQFGGPNGKKFKYKQLEDLLVAINTKPMKEQKQILITTHENWKGNMEQVDDVLVIGVKM